MVAGCLVNHTLKKRQTIMTILSFETLTFEFGIREWKGISVCLTVFCVIILSQSPISCMLAQKIEKTAKFETRKQ